MLAHRFGAMALLGALVWPAGAGATTANDICAPAADPCILGTSMTVTTGSTLDFGSRRFRMTSRARLRIPFGTTLTIRARSVTLQPGALVDHAAGAGTAGARLVIEAQEDIQLQRAALTGARISLSAADGRGAVLLTALGDVVVDGDVVVAVTAPDSDGGSVEVRAGGDASLGGDVRVFGGVGGGFGGKLTVQAVGALVVNGGVIDASGGAQGGDITLDAGLGVTTTATLDVRATGGGTDAGSVTLSAGGDVRLQGPILGTGHGSAVFGGFGGDVSVTAAGSAFLAGSITIWGGAPDGEGGILDVTAGVDIIQTGRITASGAGPEGSGDTVDFVAGRLLRLAAPIDVSGGSGGGGGAVTGQASEIRAQAEIHADGDSGSIDLVTATNSPGGVVVAGPIVVSGDLNAVGFGPGLGGDITLEGCDLTVLAGGQLRTTGATGGANVLEASRQMTVGGLLAATPGGSNELRYREPARPVSILATASIAPGASVGLFTNLRPCRSAAVAVCGNAAIETGEGCDDGNARACDGCSASCRVEACGNGVRECTEACDDGDAIDGDGCDANCTVTGCGNGVVTAGEQCDDGNRTNGDGCSSACVVERPAGCGNRVVEQGEQCDDGNAVGCDGCSAFCLTEACGNNILECQEQCDDGNTSAGDGCSPLCRTEGCGNGVLDGDEECDDGNTSNGDCCSAACQREPGLDVDANGRTESATDIVYIARHLLGLAPVPPTFRTRDPAIPPDDVIAARVDALGLLLDVDASGAVGAGTDVVYVARALLALTPVPPSFRTRDPNIPADGTITGNIQGICGGT